MTQADMERADGLWPMADHVGLIMFSREGRIRLFLAFLILVLVLTNSQSLQVSYLSQVLLTELFETQSRELSLRIASEIEREADEPTRVLTLRLASIAEARGLLSACVLDWNARLITGGACPPPEGGALDRLDEDGRRVLVRAGRSMTAVCPSTMSPRRAPSGISC